MNSRFLLTFNAGINVALGIPLMFCPEIFLGWFSIVMPSGLIFPAVLGGVLTGIGIALLIEANRGHSSLVGLGRPGAVCINTCGAGVLLFWLAHGWSDLPHHVNLMLWGVATLVLLVSIVELWWFWRSP